MNKKLTIEEIESMTVEEALERGMCSWDGDLYLIPESDFDNWPQGVVLTSILGNRVIKGKDPIDMDTRGGLLAFGIFPRKTDNIAPDE